MNAKVLCECGCGCEAGDGFTKWTSSEEYKKYILRLAAILGNKASSKKYYEEKARWFKFMRGYDKVRYAFRLAHEAHAENEAKALNK